MISDSGNSMSIQTFKKVTTLAARRYTVNFTQVIISIAHVHLQVCPFYR